jgi:Uma2 family endonuclease
MMASASMIQPIQPPQRLLLHNVTWDAYSAILEALGDRPLRLTYDGRNLEIMSPSDLHEFSKHILRRLLETYMDERAIPFRGAGSGTMRRQMLQRGLEADEGYYVVREPEVRGRRALDLAVDPLPDLVIEIDVTVRSIARLPIYAALGVLEVWRYHDGTLTIHCLHESADPPAYQEQDESTTLPGLRAAELAGFVERVGESSEFDVVREFRQWVRQALGGA